MKWYNIPGYEGRYKINEKGEVISLYLGKKRRVDPFLMTPYKSHHTAPVYGLTDKKGKKRVVALATLMAITFGDGVPYGYYATFADGDPTNVSMENIAILPRGNHKNKPVVMLDADGNVVARYGSAAEAAKANFASQSCISHYLSHRNKCLFLGEYTFVFEEEFNALEG